MDASSLNDTALFKPETVASLRPSVNGRVSGKSWKMAKSASVRSGLPAGVKVSFAERMEKKKKADAVKKLQTELREEKLVEIQRRRDITKERKTALEERKRFEEETAKMGLRKAARMKRKAGRSKKVNG